jgi:phosphoribosylaminoimidazolecarboxamide formyltransferase/IMP cyclohydrolase
MRALLSVWDKEGLLPFAQGLADLGFELVASGGTAAALDAAGIDHVDVAALTGSPEMLSGRVKTLHPKLHGGILADLSKAEHLADLEAQGITPIDLVVCNLYPFRSDPSIELIDVGGPTMVRAAAKNHAHVGIVVDPQDYDAVLAELRESFALKPGTRRALARKAFAHTAAYDAAIVAWFDAVGTLGDDDDDPDATEGGDRSGRALPETVHLTLVRAQSLRYGENPHQRGARYGIEGLASFWDTAVQHAGTALSYLNLFDADAAWRLVFELAADSSMAAVAIMKHANACGAAVGTDLTEVFRRALEVDETSAFGGIIAVGGTIDESVATAIAGGPQADVVIGRELTDGAREILVARRKATRLLTAFPPEAPRWSLRTIGDSVLLQEPDEFVRPPEVWEVATKRAPTARELADLVLAWRVCGRTTSNAIAIARDGQAVGIGAGQQSRVVAADLAVAKAGERARGAAAASDAFFPFADGLAALIDAGVTSVIQPGGSIRDGEVVAAADEAGIAMMLTGERHFRH